MEIPVEPLLLPILAACFVCVCVLCGWKIVKLVLWDYGFDLLPLPRCIRRMLWYCGVSCSNCSYVLRDSGSGEMFSLNCEPNPDDTSEDGETFIL